MMRSGFIITRGFPSIIQKVSRRGDEERAKREIVDERIGSKGLESKLIGTVSGCTRCKPSVSWLGNYSPKKQIRASGLWLTQHLNTGHLTGGYNGISLSIGYLS